MRPERIGRKRHKPNNTGWMLSKMRKSLWLWFMRNVWIGVASDLRSVSLYKYTLLHCIHCISHLNNINDSLFSTLSKAIQFSNCFKKVKNPYDTRWRNRASTMLQMENFYLYIHESWQSDSVRERDRMEGIYWNGKFGCVPWAINTDWKNSNIHH